MEKMKMRTRSNSYKFLMMPFGFCNVSLMFTTLVNLIFHEKLDEFMIIYIDDILVYFKMAKEHAENLEYVLNKLHVNNFFANRVKSELA